MRINWFSPLLPQRTDIAHYTARIAQALMGRFEVVFWSNLDADPDLLPAGAPIERFAGGDHGRDFHERLFDGVNLYNLGNDARFHAAIAGLALRIPGVAILHDVRLHHAAFEASRRDDPPFASYRARAEALYGARGVDAARRVIASEGRAIDDHVEAMAFAEPYLEASLGAICHAPAAHDQLRARSDTPLMTLPLPFRSLAAGPAARPSRSPPWRLVMYGYINANRRLESILAALADWEAPFRFDVYGELWDRERIEGLIAVHGLGDRVSVHGYVPEAELDKAIAGAQLAFNLRHPTMGEASGGILRAWALGTPALVTNAGWYAGLPDEVAWKVSQEKEAADLRSALEVLAADPGRFADMGRAAKAYAAERHTPEAYVRDLEAGLADFPALAERFAGRLMLRRAAERGVGEERAAALDRACLAIPQLLP